MAYYGISTDYGLFLTVYQIMIYLFNSIPTHYGLLVWFGFF